MWSLWTPLGRISGHTPCTDCKVKKPQTHFLAEVVLSLAWHFTVFHGDLAFSSRSKFTKNDSIRKLWFCFGSFVFRGGGGGIWQIIKSINTIQLFIIFLYLLFLVLLFLQWAWGWFHLTTKLHFDRGYIQPPPNTYFN